MIKLIVLRHKLYGSLKVIDSEMLSYYLQNEKNCHFSEFWHFQMLPRQDSFVQLDLLKSPKNHGRQA